MPACALARSLARSEGSGPACPPARLSPPRPVLPIEEAEELTCVSVPLPCCTRLGEGGGGWPGLRRCYFSMHQIVFMTPGEIYLILTFQRIERILKVMHSSRRKFLKRRLRPEPPGMGGW